MSELIYNRGEVLLGLSRMYSLMGKIGNPQDKKPVIQIAGTNGKGSVGGYLRRVLEELGMRVGHYQTPAVFDPMEIISVNGINISEDEFEEYKRAILKVVEDDEKPTKFELDTAIAYKYFEDRCDIEIIETGLGGDLDATNVTKESAVSVITSIGFDHMEYLGNSLAEIAYHKAGILKPGGRAVFAMQTEEVMEVLRLRAKELGASYVVAEEERAHVSYQRINKGVARAALLELYKAGYLGAVSESELIRAIEKCFKDMQLFGRFFYAGYSPDFILDGAHNPHGAKELRKTLDEIYPDRKRIFITGAFSDKEYLKAITSVVKKGDMIYTITAPGKRGLDARTLAEELREAGIDAKPMEDIKEAVEKAVKTADPEDVIIAFGSLSWLREAMDIYENQR